MSKTNVSNSATCGQLSIYSVTKAVSGMSSFILVLKLKTIILLRLLIYNFFQLHFASTRYHIVPFTLIPVVYRLVKCQGIAVLWKGFGTVLLLKGMTMAVEAFLSEIFNLPK